MPPGGGSTPRNIVGGDVQRKPPLRIFKRSREKISPQNLQWERHVLAVDAMHEERKQTGTVKGSLSFNVVWHSSYLEIFEGYHDGEITWNDVSGIRGTSTPPLVTDSSQQGEGQRPLKDSANKPPADDTEFLKGTNYFKTNSDKQKATTRNKRSSKKHKKKGKGKGKARKQSHASEMHSDEPPTEPSSTCVAVASGETSASSSSRAAIRVPLEYSSSSYSSQVTAKHIITPAVNSAFSGNEKELSASSSNDDFKSFKSTTSYTTAASSSVKGYASSLSDSRSERSLSASVSTDSRGFKKMSSEGNKPNVHQSFSLAIGPGCSQEALLCTDYARNDDGDFQIVVSRKSAQKIKRMQRQEMPSPSSTMAASGPVITRELVPRAPFREVITMAHYINDETFYGRKPNQKKGKYQKARSLSKLSKTSYTEGDNVSGSSRMIVIATVHQTKPSSSHHVTREAIEETNSPSCLPKKKELEAMAPVGDGIGNTDAKATFDKTSSLGSLANCSYREEQEKAVPLVGSDTEDVRPPSSDSPSSLGHLYNSSCADRKEQRKSMALVGGDTDDTDSRAPNYERTLSLSNLVISSCAHSEEKNKEENSIAFSRHASSDLGNIIRAANDAYEIQVASDVYMSSGIHSDIENFLHAATPVIGQISCTKSNISLQDKHLWSVWSWYEEPECCGIEVQMQGKTNSIWPEFSTYFRPLLSAVQLFGQLGMPENHGGLIFEFFESESPFLRPPIFTRIKQLRDGVNFPGFSIFGDPKQLESVKLSDLHPASWFCVAWYPICQIPAAAGSCKASFLTYHSLGKLVPQTCSMDKADGHDRLICPIVGLVCYNHQGEKWFQLREQLRFKPTLNNVFSETNHAELLNKRLRTLRQGASIMSKAVVPRASGEAMNNHFDYEYILSRSPSS